ncbi:MAG: 1-deoxy-D-xylulose-5-phosphate reductoisomerase [Pseudomonadota bacterium]
MAALLDIETSAGSRQAQSAKEPSAAEGIVPAAAFLTPENAHEAPLAPSHDNPRSVTILGATGSIGCSTIDLIERDPDSYRVEALVANRNVNKLVKQALSVRPRVAVVADQTQFEALRDALAGTGIEVAAGQDAVIEAAQRPSDWVMSGIVGAAGLAPTLEAVRRGAMVALANKEALICSGELMRAEVHKAGARLLPVDSEHNAIYQVWEEHRRESISKIILTASGGPFRQTSLADMAKVTPAQAVKHPNWSMGAKISIDSATMMNKGLEYIEAFYLFGLPQEQISILVHPQSIIHSMVEYQDGSVLAQLGTPDMRTPISYTLAWPGRMKSPSERLDLAAISTLTFENPDEERFPAIRLTREALRTGGLAPTIMNAANEIAVAAFLGERIGFLDIPKTVEEVLQKFNNRQLASLEDVFEADATGRRLATEIVGEV